MVKCLGTRDIYILTSMVSLPSATAVSKRQSIVSSPGSPGGGLAESFSDTVWGAEEEEQSHDSHKTMIQQFLMSCDNYHGQLRSSR